MLTSSVHNHSYSQSFKLQKLNKSMDLKSDSFRKHSLSTTPRIYAMNSVEKSVKYNNLTFITGQQLCKLRRQPQQSLQNPQFSTAKTNMVGIRKRYDQVNQQKLYLDNKIQRLTEERDKYLTIQKQFTENKSEGKQKVNNMQTQLDNLKFLLQDKGFQKLSMQQMNDVIRHDKIVYDQRKFDMQKHLRNLKVKFKSIHDEHLHHVQQDDRTLKVYQKFIKHLNGQNKERNQHISSMQQRVIEKDSINNSSVLRKSQMQMIAETAMCEKSPQQKEWLRIFWTHKMLQDLLKCKIQREMNKFSVVESAFKNIKIATGVSNADMMVKKFLSKQEIYGDLLSKITQDEKQILILKKQQQQYLKSIKKVQQQLQQLQTIKTYNFNISEQLKVTQYYDQKKKHSEFQSMKLKQFLFKQFKIFKNNINISTNNKPQKKFRINNTIQLKNKFIQYLTQLSSLIDQSITLQSHSIDHQSTNQQQFFNQSHSSISQNIMHKILRIKPHTHTKITPNTSFNSINNDKNFIDQYQNHFDQQDLPTSNDQIESIEQQRQVLLKSNQKFMKELRLKKQQQKKIIIQTLVKNNKQKVPLIPTKKIQQPIQ